MKADMDTDRLIEAVRRHPLLYNKSDAMYYTHKKHKAKIWNDVCREVFPNWDTYRPQDKVEYRHELQKRWKSLRTCFSRELALQKKEKIQLEKEGKVKRRKRYEYFEALSFLLNPDITSDTDLNRDEDDESSEPLENFKTESVYDEPSTAASDCSRIVVVPNEVVASPQIPYYERNDSLSEQRIVEIIRELKKDEEDEDRQFMLSLVPCFRKLNDKQKFEARIQILKVLKEVSFHEKDS